MRYTPREVYKLLKNVRNIFEDNKCWLKGRDSLVYATVELENGKVIRAHRMSYEFFNRVWINSDMMACHKCDTRNCINPSHIFVGTASDNTRDAINKGRVTKPTLKKKRVELLTFCGDFKNGY